MREAIQKAELIEERYTESTPIREGPMVVKGLVWAIVVLLSRGTKRKCQPKQWIGRLTLQTEWNECD